MDKILFLNLCQEYAEENRLKNGIGTLSEKTIHAVLKDYMDANPAHQEQPLSHYVADIYDGSAVVEVQTRAFNRLRDKLDAFLIKEQLPVTIVHPIAHIKYLRWINEETGEISEPRKSPKKGKPVDVMRELYKIKRYLKDPNLHLHLFFLDVEEYRLLNGWSHDKKRGSVRQERIPIDFSYEITIDSPEDYTIFLPEHLPEVFTSKDFRTLSGTSLSTAQTALNILTYMGVVKRIGKKGNLILYERSAPPVQKNK